MKRYHLAWIAAIAAAAGSVYWLRTRPRQNPPVPSAPPGQAVWAEGIVLPGQDKDAPAAHAPLLAARSRAGAARVTVDYPLEGSIFPPEIVAPTFLWHDADAYADRWLVEVAMEGGRCVYAVTDGPAPAPEAADPRCVAKTNEPPRLTERQAGGHTWTPGAQAWSAIKTHSANSPARVSVYGFRGSEATKLLSRGQMTFTTSKDPVAASIFYRDVPLMPTETKEGKIEPLAEQFLGLIAWRLKDIGRPDSKAVLQDMPTCANCHSFSADGKTLAMDVDGPTGDKGAYAIGTIAPNMVIGGKEIMTWNSWDDKARTGKTIGFLSQVSPDGRYALSTVNEAVHVVNFPDYRFLQVFYPTRGIIVCYDRTTGKIRPLPGADDGAFVQCDPAWSPDGQWIVFARAAARDARPVGWKAPTRANDPAELPIQYDLYRVPFNGGAGGKAEPIAGASANGESNTFPKVSPDGKWIVYVRCRNGQLMRPDSTLWIVPSGGGQPRKMACNTPLMNSWHSFSPNGRWMVFASKSAGYYTRAFLTHIGEQGEASPAILLTGMAAGNRAVNIPEFVNIAYDALNTIAVPSLDYWRDFHRGMDLAGRSRHAEAIECFRRGLKADPASARLMTCLADSLVEARQEEEALNWYDKLLRADPGNYSLHGNRGNALLRLGRQDEALVELSEAVRLRPDAAFVHANRAVIFAQRRQYPQALDGFNAALKYDPTLSWVWYNRGKVKDLMGDTAGAIADLTRCLELAPADWSELPTVRTYLKGLQDDLKASGKP